MASTFAWVTPQGTIGNVFIDSAVSLQVVAADFKNPAATPTYKVISGLLPTGLSLSTQGVITGVPTYSDPADTNWTAEQYNFLVRASLPTGETLDRNFIIIVSNNVNKNFRWVTPPGKLGTVPNNEFYQFPLQVYNSYGDALSFKFISGELPPGVQISANGYIEGVPTLLNSIKVDESQTFRFTVRVLNTRGHINDRGFSLTVTNVYGPIIEPTTVSLGSYFDGVYFEKQLSVLELSPTVKVTWSTIGELPPGITLSDNGLLSGYIQPLQLVGAFGPAGYDGDAENQGVITQEQQFDYAPYDFNQLNQTLTYSFTIQAYDGSNYDLQQYTVNVVSRSGFTADNDKVTVDNTDLSVDSISVYVPVLLNASDTTLPTGRSGSYYAFKFDGYDFQGDTLTYTLSNTLGTFDAYVYGQDAGFDYGGTGPLGTPESQATLGNPRGGVGFDSYNGGNSSTNLPGLVLDAQTGWLYGKLNQQSTAFESYSLGVQISKVREGETYTSSPVYFTLPILGDINNVIQWITPSNLGSITNGEISKLVLEAKSIEDKPLVYTLVDKGGVPIRLPQGLKLLPSGEISGRVSFEAFSVDNYDTTFDGEKLTIDRNYKFTVKVSTADGSASAVQEFNLVLNINDIKPYDNLYLRAMPSWDQRQIFNSVINDTTIFVPELIYRPTDPWFGVSKNIDMLFVPGLNPLEINEFALAIVKNHWHKRYTFGDIKTATVLDDSYLPKYEVVYIDVLDPELNEAGNGPGLELNLTNTIANPYVDINGNTFKILYPNTTDNMLSRLTTDIGYYDQSTLPDWMTSNQPDTTSSNKFKPPLGFTKAVVLAYTKPGASNLIAYRLKSSGINFNNINFTVDRYLLDDYYTSNFNTSSQIYNLGRETTFDTQPNQNVGAIKATVQYAVTVPFNQIHGRPVSYVKANGGIDGDKLFDNGDTLIFAQQENFLNPGPYQGWVQYSNAYIGDNILTSTIEGYGSGTYDSYTIVPGFLEKAQGTAATNYRGGVWRINIVGDVISLIPVLEMDPGDKVRVLFGGTYASAILFYNQTLYAGQSVPYYSVYKLQSNTIRRRTTFNGDTTKFFSRRDQYYAPGTNDKYVKFPQYGVFN